MAAQTNALLRYINGMGSPSATNEASDAVLVNQFIADRDGRAFAALVNRHGSLVLQVCRRILGDSHDAEDALQATFLVLARKAQGLRSRESLAGWLHGVALRVSLKARAVRARRLRLELATQRQTMARPDPMEEISCREVLTIIDEEIERLPEKQRLPILLCCLEGLSLEEAAGRLGWKPLAVKGRLQRGRCRLHESLVRRGLTLSAALAAVEASRGSTTSPVIARLAAAAGRAAPVLATSQAANAEGISAGAAALARADLRNMALTKLAIAAGFLLPICLVVVGFAGFGTEKPVLIEHVQSEGAPMHAAATLVEDKRAETADDSRVPIKVNGRVLDPAGKPFPGANLYVGYAFSGRSLDLVSPQGVLPLRAKSGADGSFQFTLTRADLDAGMLDVSRPAVIAVANGYGPEWSQIVGAGQAENITLKLVVDVPLNGRVIDSKGKPVQGAKIRVLNIESDSEENVTRRLAGLEAGDDRRRRWSGAFPERPVEVTSGSDGRFRLTGLGRDRIAMLIQDETLRPDDFFYAIARQSGTAATGQFHAANFELTAPDTRLVRGICRDEVTGKPLAGVGMSVKVWNHRPGGLFASKARFTDEDGRFEFSVAADVLASTQAESSVIAEPVSGQPYFASSALLQKTAGTDPITMNFDLVRGIPVAGKVKAAPGGKPPDRGRAEYYPLKPNIHAAKLHVAWSTYASSGEIQPDGSYHLVVLPGPGAVAVTASPQRLFAAAVITDQQLASIFRDRNVSQDSQCLSTIVGTCPGSLRLARCNAVSLINPDETAQSLALDVQVRAGVRLRGVISDPNGQRLAGVWVVGLTRRQPAGEVLEGPSFEITELTPGETRQLLFMHREKKLGGILMVHDNEIGPFDVRLEPCSSITGRLVGKTGLPVPNSLLSWIGFEFGPRISYSDGIITTDKDGRFEKALVPRVKYSIGRRLLIRGMPVLLNDIILEPGITRDLGDISLDDIRRPSAK